MPAVAERVALAGTELADIGLDIAAVLRIALEYSVVQLARFVEDTVSALLRRLLVELGRPVKKANLVAFLRDTRNVYRMYRIFLGRY